MNLQSFILKSLYSDKPLAAIRVAGDRYEVVTDNTNGQITKLGKGKFSELQRIVSRSSHLELENSQKSVPTYRRYLLTNGDAVEMTSDGLTVMLNDRLLNEGDKQLLLDAINSGEIQVQRQGRTDAQYEVMPEIRVQPKKTDTGKLDLQSAQQVMSKVDESNKRRVRATSKYDEDIEDAQFDTLDPAFTKELAYGFQYGKLRNE